MSISMLKVRLNSNNKDIIEFSIDSGLGERNSLGFGFMNLIRGGVPH